MIWKYNRVTGLWQYQRTCAADTAERWLHIFRTDDPRELFMVSARKPKRRQ